jgi:hypothetical protein
MTGPGFEPRSRGRKPATNRLSYGAAQPATNRLELWRGLQITLLVLEMTWDSFIHLFIGITLINTETLLNLPQLLTQ